MEDVSQTRVQRVRFFAGVDEPLLQAFGGDRVAHLMRSLGIGEEEKITHAMIDKSIVNAQTKIDKRAAVSLPADSDEEWFRVNLPGK